MTVFLIALAVGFVFGFGPTLALCRASKLGDESVGLTAGTCEYPGCVCPWTASVDLSPDKVVWVCDKHVQSTVSAHLAPFEAMGVRSCDWRQSSK